MFSVKLRAKYKSFLKSKYIRFIHYFSRVFLKKQLTDGQTCVESILVSRPTVSPSVDHLLDCDKITKLLVCSNVRKAFSFTWLLKKSHVFILTCSTVIFFFLFLWETLLFRVLLFLSSTSFPIRIVIYHSRSSAETVIWNQIICCEHWKLILQLLS